MTFTKPTEELLTSLKKACEVARKSKLKSTDWVLPLEDYIFGRTPRSQQEADSLESLREGLRMLGLKPTYVTDPKDLNPPENETDMK